MKYFLPIVLAIATASGCSDSEYSNVPVPADVSFDEAIEIIATSDDWDYVNSAQMRLSTGGLPAIKRLCNHLSDDRVIPSGYTIASINSGDVTVGENARWTIQQMIETLVSKRYGPGYFITEQRDIQDWLDAHEGATLLELRIEAASFSLSHARTQVVGGDRDASDAVRELEQTLEKLRASLQRIASGQPQLKYSDGG